MDIITHRDSIATTQVVDSPKISSNIEGDTLNNIEADEVVPTHPSDREEVEVEKNEPIYDVVTTTRYLTTIAQEHYGNYEFWPYIYEENASKLGHPNKIRPGTKVVVPDLKMLGIDTNNPQDEKKARRKGAEIYSRYK
ncbi:MAG: hypothetical protein NC097_00245 [Clostridium sp.]|nr:hypothetical protein [Clostridium sp.]